MAFTKIEKLSPEGLPWRDERWIYRCEAGHEFAMQTRCVKEGECPLCKIGLVKGKNDFLTMYPHVAGDLVNTGVPTFETSHPSNIVATQSNLLRFRCPKCNKIYRAKVAREVKRHACPNCGPIPQMHLEGEDFVKALLALPEGLSNQITFFDTGSALMVGAGDKSLSAYLFLRPRRKIGEKFSITIDRQRLFQLARVNEEAYICGWNGKIYTGGKVYRAKAGQVPEYPSYAMAKARGYRPPNLSPDVLVFWSSLAKSLGADSVSILGDKDGGAVLAALDGETQLAVGQVELSGLVLDAHRK